MSTLHQVRERALRRCEENDEDCNYEKFWEYMFEALKAMKLEEEASRDEK